MKKILIVGYTGKLGGAVLKKIFPYGKVRAFTPKHQELDISKLSAIDRYFEKFGPFDIIINAAGFLHVDLAEKEPISALETNGISLYHLAKISKKDRSLLVHFSTDYVFDGQKKAPYTEEDSKNPLNIYGKSKLIGENIIETIGGAYLIFRTSWLYGDHGKNFLSMIWNKSFTEETLHIVDDQIGTPTYVEDLADGVIKIMMMSLSGEKIPSSTLHLSGPTQTSWYGLASFILKEIKKHRPHSELKLLPISTENYSKKNEGIANRPLYSALCSDKINKEYSISLNRWEENIPQLISKMEKLR